MTALENDTSPDAQAVTDSPPAKQTASPKRKRGNPTGRNQWTKIHEAKRRGDINGFKADRNWRDRYSAESIIEPLAEHAAGRKRLKPTQIKAAEILLDRLEPRLSAVEQTQVNPDDLKSPQELLRELGPLLKAHPEWLRELGFQPIVAVRDASDSQLERDGAALTDGTTVSTLSGTDAPTGTSD